ncbi:protein kinase [Nocardia sp. NPDC004860]|uniref:protein kinase domain-containing protein n=1 Tax=Nocardia sp. NPDC004860 TaxID=3154557 RepID=UPI0033A19AA5
MIGRGGFGVVYRCEQPELDRTVAVKVLTTDVDRENLARFLREQRAMGKLSGHPNIVAILFSGELAARHPYLVMPYHPRKSLQDIIERDGPLPWQDAVRVGVKVAGALEAAHRCGVLHRDVKPGNILMSDYGEPELTDFGIAHVAGGFVTTSGLVTGSPAFTAPEVLTGGEPSRASDVYGLGATLFALVTGHAAFERREGERVVSQFLRITSEPIPDLHTYELPDDLCHAIERAMAGDPADRYASAAAFGDELAEIQSGHGLPVDRMVLPIGAETLDSERKSPVTTQGLPSTAPRSVVRGRTPTPMPPPTAATRFRPPIPAHPLVVRERLLELLRDHGQRRRLVLIHGPAGFGKSTVAAQWRDILADRGAHVAWLGIDRDDNNLVWFLAHLIEALRPALPALAERLRELLEVHGEAAEPYICSTLVDEIHSGGEHVALIIDDWHRVTDAAGIAALGRLLEHGCHHLQVIVTSRSRTGLPLSTMRVHDEVVEIDPKDLRFTVSEARSYFTGVGGPALTDSDIASLTASTDGWVAALQLASLSLRGGDDPSELIGHLSGRHHAIAEFLAENVLDGLDPRTLEFVLRTSITERLSPGLASELSGMPDGTALLEEVEARDLFLSRADAEGEWFRYHQLFADFLRRRLERDHPDWIPELHRRASRWFADHHLLSPAVDHALAGDDQARAVELVEADGAQLLEQSQMSTLLALIAKLPAAAVNSSLPLQLDTVWANLLLQRRTAAGAALQQVRALLERDDVDRTAAIEIEAAVVDAAVRVSADRLDGVEELLSRALARPQELHPWVVTTAADMATFVAIYRFDFAAAHRWQQWAADYHRRMRGPFSVMYGHCFDGIAASEELDIAGAEAAFRAALEVAAGSGGGRSHAARIASALLGDLLFDLGDMAAAERLLDESYELGGEGGIVDFMLATYGTGARVKALRGDFDMARQRLRDGRRLATALDLPRLAARLNNEGLRFGITAAAEGDSNVPSPAVATDGVDGEIGDGGIAMVTAELVEDSAIRELLARRSAAATTEACSKARARRDRIAGQHRPRALLQASLLLVTCLAEAGETAEATRILLPVARQCADLSLVGLLRFSGPAVLAVLRGLEHEDASGNGSTLPEAFLAAVLA